MELVVYFDDSGTHLESTTAVAACFVSTASKWQEFETRWREICQREQIELLHTAELAAGRGRYQGWDFSRRERIIDKFVEVLDGCVYSGFSFGVIKREYDEVIEPQGRKLHFGDHHYTFAVRSCIGHMGVWRKMFFPETALQYIFDRTGNGKQELQRVMEAAQKSAPLVLRHFSFEDKSKFVPLQAADLFAWTTYQAMQANIDGKYVGRVGRFAFKRIKAMTAKPKFLFYTRKSLEDWSKLEMQAYVANFLK